MSTFRLRDISVYYQGRNKEEITVLDSLSADFELGKIHVIVGPSGAGKSTLLRVLSGAVYFSGSLFLDDLDFEQTKIQDRNMSYVNQEMTLYPSLTVYENIAFPLKAKKMPFPLYDQKVKEVADLFEITPLLTRKPKYISLGQASRVVLARSLVKESDISLFDEPLAHLEEVHRNELLRLLKKEWKEKETTVFYVTHNIKEALAIADDILLIKDGKACGKFSVDEFLSSKSPDIREMISLGETQ